jgi:hypothetical protein
MGWLSSIGGCIRDNVSNILNWFKSASFGVATVVGVIKTDINNSIKIFGFVLLAGGILFAIVRIHQTSASSLVQLFREPMDKKNLIIWTTVALVLIYPTYSLTAGLMSILKSVSNAAIVYLLTDNKNSADRIDMIKRLNLLTIAN